MKREREGYQWCKKNPYFKMIRKATKPKCRNTDIYFII